jgi:heme iron utilization protein
MHLPIEAVVQLLHEATFAAIATHSMRLAGYPFASVIPFAPDDRHRPVMLMSSLAEHTKNIDADPRASLLLFRAEGEDVQSGARLTLLGDVARFEPTAALRSRFVRYQPDAAGHLALGDFSFYRIEPRQMRMVAGFGRMGWIDGDALTGAAALDPDDEARLLASVSVEAPPDGSVLGVDCYGVDLRMDDTRHRISFPSPEHDPQALAGVAIAAMREFREFRLGE